MCHDPLQKLYTVYTVNVRKYGICANSEALINTIGKGKKNLSHNEILDNYSCLVDSLRLLGLADTNSWGF